MPSDIDGESFAGALDEVEAELEPRTHFMEHHYTVGVRTERWKLIRRGEGTLELYDLAADPLEQHDCRERHPEVAARRQAACEHTIEEREALDAGERVEVDPQTLEQLKGLGYL